MAASQIIGSTYAEGLKAPHYINRRLLTAEDLKADQQTNLARLGVLGRAVGYGVVEGLEVAQVGSTTLRVDAGLGFNRGGNPLRMPQATTLTFSAPTTLAGTALDGGRFQDCAISSGGGAGATPDKGAYLLVVAPISRLEGNAPVKAAAGSTSTPPCAAQWEVEGLEFRAIALDGFAAEAGVTDTNRRNRLAHWCYGSAGFPALERDYLTMPAQYTALDRLGPQDLTGCDLPLAVFYWSGSALSDVDLWSVRRRLVQSGGFDVFGALIGDRRTAEGQARFLQFQAHLRALEQTAAGGITAATSFPMLPPAGLIHARLPERVLRAVVAPLVAELTSEIDTLLSGFGFFFEPFRAQVHAQLAQVADSTIQATTQTGLDPDVFFGAALRYGLIDPDAIDDIIRQSWYHNAFAAGSTTPVELYVPYADVVQLVAPALISAVQSAIQLVPFFNLPVFAMPRIEQMLRERIAALTDVAPAAVTLNVVQPATLFAKQLRPTIVVEAQR